MEDVVASRPAAARRPLPTICLTTDTGRSQSRRLRSTSGRGDIILGMASAEEGGAGRRSENPCRDPETPRPEPRTFGRNAAASRAKRKLAPRLMIRIFGFSLELLSLVIASGHDGEALLGDDVARSVV